MKQELDINFHKTDPRLTLPPQNQFGGVSLLLHTAYLWLGATLCFFVYGILASMIEELPVENLYLGIVLVIGGIIGNKFGNRITAVDESSVASDSAFDWMMASVEANVDKDIIKDASVRMIEAEDFTFERKATGEMEEFNKPDTINKIEIKHAGTLYGRSRILDNLITGIFTSVYPCSPSLQQFGFVSLYMMDLTCTNVSNYKLALADMVVKKLTPKFAVSRINPSIGSKWNIVQTEIAETGGIVCCCVNLCMELSATTAALQFSPCYEIVVRPDPELDHEPRYNFMNEVDEIANYGTKLELTD